MDARQMDQLVIRFRRQFARYRGALALGAFAAGCDGGGVVDLAGFSPLTCVNDAVPLFRAGSSPAPFDSMSAYSRGQVAVLVDSIGTACLGAPHPDDCKAAVQMAIGGSNTIVTTLGDEVVGYNGEAAVGPLLGDISSLEEATLRAWARGLDFSCGDVARGGFRVVDGGWEFVGTQLVSACAPVTQARIVVRVDASGATEEIARETASSDPNACIGRLPPGLRPRAARSGNDAGSLLAANASLEAAAVPAFLQLAADLAHHGAPPALVRAALRAAGDEVRHARSVGQLARRFGAEPDPVSVHFVRPRPLMDIAVENATEGCARETLGALVGHVQAASATDPAVRAVMEPIARDETFHAALSWAIDGWARTRLSTTARRALTDARHEASRGLHGGVAQAYESADRDARAHLGLPVSAPA